MEEEKLFYNKSGNGDRHLVLFHGFGQSHEIFDSWMALLKDDYTIYSFDLYYHGASHRPNKPLVKPEWQQSFESFLNDHQIQRFSIGAFSLGGRFALLTAVQFAKQVDQLILVAPDGVFRSRWYDVAVHRSTNPIFSHLMHHPTHFEYLVSISEKFGLAPGSLVRFARNELSNPSNRRRVYQSWTYFKGILLENEYLTSQLNQSGIAINIILGAKDPIIPQEKVLPKLKGIKDLQHHIINARHHELGVASKTLVASLLLTDNS